MVLSGEHIFMDCSVQSIVSNQIISSGAMKSCKPMLFLYAQHFCISVVDMHAVHLNILLNSHPGTVVPLVDL